MLTTVDSPDGAVLVDLNFCDDDRPDDSDAMNSELEYNLSSHKSLENFYVPTDTVLHSTLHRDWSTEYLLKELSIDMND